MHYSNSKVRKYLESNKFKDIYFFPHGRFARGYRNKDLEFDGICSKDKKLVLFQVKSNYKISKKLLKQYKKLSKEFGILCLWFDVVNRRGVKIYG